MSDTIDEIIDGILEREGAYVDRPEDKGGPTRFGITLDTLADWRKPKPVTVADVQTLTQDEARLIYRREYVEKPGFSFVAWEPLQALLVDCAVNHGQDRAVRWLQLALGVTVDGQFGSETKDALDAASQMAVYDRVLATRIRFYGHLITHDPKQAIFAEGWANRVAGFVDRA